MKSGKQNGLFISEEFLALVVILIALGMRLLHVLFTTGGNPLAAHLTLDAAVYDRWAKALVWGGAPVPTRLMQAPLYPWMLSIIYHIFGPSLTAVRLVQAVMGTASCAFTIVITRRLFRSSAAGIVAGAAAALYVPFIFYEGVLVPATLIVFLNLLAVLLLVPEGHDPGPVRVLAAGIVLGLSAIAKPVALLLVPFAVLDFYFTNRVKGPPTKNDAREGKPNVPMILKKSGMLTAGIVLTLIPLTVRNYRIAGEFIPLTTGGGINFYIGNNERANGFYAVPSYRGTSIGGTPEEQQKLMNELAAAESGGEPSPGAVSRFWMRRGIAYITANPGEWAALVWRKFLFFWNRYERANVESMRFHRRFGGVIGLPLITFGIIAPLGLLGIFTARHRWRELWLLYGGVIVYLAAAIIFYVLARYRLPVVPFLAPFAGISVTGLLKLLRDGHRAEPAVLAAALAILFYFVNMTVAADTPAGSAGNLKRLGNAYLARGDTTSAVQAFREAVRIDPTDDRLRRALESLDRHRQR
jgi:GNAT superfamily N-acetyltransferase